MNEESKTTRSAAIVAVFTDRDAAHAAVGALHDVGFHHTWTGVTWQRDEATNDPGQSPIDRIGRLFAGEDRTKTLSDELVERGVAERDARRIERSLSEICTILTVDGSDRSEVAADLIGQNGGAVLAGATRAIPVLREEFFYAEELNERPRSARTTYPDI